MRTKALLLTAALSVAGIATSMAQAVYSVNAVGYVNVTVPTGFQLIANPLDAEDNSIGALLPDIAEGTIIYKFNATSGTYSINSFQFGAWDFPTATLNPGEGAFIFNGEPAALTLTFVGEVPQGPLSQAVPAGFSIQASQVPQQGGIQTALEFPAEEGDLVYRFDTTAQTYRIFDFNFGEWSPSEPVINVGESVFVNKAAATTWSRTFSVNN